MEIKLASGKGVALVDFADYGLVSRYNWSYRYNTHDKSKGYAQSWINGKTVSMHRMIMHAQKGQEIDHINGNGLDNRRDNLRFCTHAENARNGKQRANTSGYRGVYWNKRQGNWQVQIRNAEGRLRWLGNFINVYDAAQAYNFAACIYHGKFARYNQPN